MDPKSLAMAIAGFLLGGLVVSTAASIGDDAAAAGPGERSASMATTDHDLAGKRAEAFEEAFIAEMIGHHRGAVQMARLAVDRAEHAQVRELARSIISAQRSEIAQMRRWQHQWEYDASGQPGHGSG